ncbi:phosphate transport system substrate-binding protein [Kitasatospora gansuensis]|uniref:Phosphate-binding protein n=1 Tax=Kitasatospora gansuensis TaxID=258050 RepID=A0A7W7SBU3_9ACTN|nr:phosphate ABC transporter substrate-binding protein PstS [Kitasatospora gansuensis]MBB4947599.1 phosphate transport system substrate-binding protein [Kitasatospora gansuensis]
MKLQRNGRSKALAIGAMALVGSLSLAACGSDDNADPKASGSAAPSAAAIACGKAGQLLGAGSTAQQSAVDVWKVAYGNACAGSTITYSGGGSGAGVQQFNQGKVAFAGSDSALKPAEVDASKEVCKTGQGINLPLVAGLIAIVYNVDGVDNLVLDGPTLAGIFDSKIVKWNDPAIVKLNPTAKLPDAEIQAVHRSDDSGTTDNFTKYLEKTSAGAWPYKAAKTWAGKGGQSAAQNAGVSAQVKQVKNSISYAELAYAQTNNLKSAAIATGASKPVEATAANAATTFAKAKIAGTGSDLALSLDYGTKDEGAYPLVLVTYEIVCDKGNKAETLDTLKSFLTYAISDGGQQAISTKGYVPLPKELSDKVKTAVTALA